jgi:uncharacterized protein (DUF362 family)
MKSKVAFVKGKDRYTNISKALSLIEGEIDLSGKKNVFIKPNFVSTTRQLAATHMEAVKAVLDFIIPRYEGTITIGEGAGMGETFNGYRNFGYLELADSYGVELVDLNKDEWVHVRVYDRNLNPMYVRVAVTALRSDFRISVGPPKTHDTVVVTASLKNMVVGSLIRGRGGGLFQGMAQRLPSWLARASFVEEIKGRVISAATRSDKFAIHQGYQAINLNLYTLAKLLHPHLSVIDGFVGMEGEGPINGDPVELGIAIASTDFLAADSIAARVMGFDVDEIGYLYYCKLSGLGAADLDDIELVGNATIEECSRRFKPHSTYRRQLQWRVHDFEKFLGGMR